MKNRIETKIARKRAKAIVKKSTTGDVTCTKYSDGSCVLTVKGKLNEELCQRAKERGISPGRFLKKAITRDSINRAIAILAAEKAAAS